MRTHSMLAAALGVMAASVGTANAVFDPTLYAGTWTGTWKNLTFKVSNTFTTAVTVPSDGSSLTTNYTIQGLFNCGTVAGPRTLVKGVDFTDAGLKFSTTNPAWGTATVTSVSKKTSEKIVAKGTVPCNTGVKSWVLHAKLTGTKMTGKMTIVFVKGQKPRKAKDTFVATKQ